MQKVLSILIISFILLVAGLCSVNAQTFNKNTLQDFARNQLQKKKTTQVDSSKKLPIIYQSANLGAAKAVHNHQIWSGGITGLSLSGSAILIGYWDEDQPRLSHQEYLNRVTFEDSEAGSNNVHATHMVGTMIATGVNANAKGMANQATVEAWNWNSDIAEMATEAASGLTLSSHPYIETAGWTINTGICDPNSNHPDVEWMWFSLESEDSTKAYQFGYYDSQAQKWDSVAYLAPNYLIVKASGNQRGEGPSSQPIKHWTYDSDFNCIQDSTTVRELDGGSNGFESTNGASLAKNVLIVGAVESSSDNFDALNSISPTSSSGFGPTDDGRIKPDIVAPTGVFTSTSSSNTSYSTGSGTSASSAIVAGSIALLREHYQNLHSDTLSSASIRALLAQTAEDIGNEGPDYKTGWGLLNTERAARFISSHSSSTSNTVLKDTVLNNGSTIQFDFEHTSNRPLIITIAWTDPAGTPPVDSNDPSDTLLVNDLDLTVSDPNSTTLFPWKLNPSTPDISATTGDNDVDNIEQVFIKDAESGTYSITISHEGNLQSGSQRVSILVGESEPEIEFVTIASGNWKNASTWSGGTAPSTSLHRATLKHSVTLDTSLTLRGITFQGSSSELILNEESLNLYGGVFHDSGGLGFSGDTSSALNIFKWDSGSDSLKFRSGFQNLDSLKISATGDTIKLGSELRVYSKLSLISGVFDASTAGLKLISNTTKTAWLEKTSGKVSGNLTYSRLYSEESSGWRMISSPVQNELFSTLSDSFHTQGGAWADYSVPETESSLWLFDSSSQTFGGQSGADSSFTSGEGYLFYLFDESPEETQLPGFLEFTGSEPDSVTLDLHRGAHDSLSYNLVGNPFAGTLDWHEIVNDGVNMGTTYAVWDPSGITTGGSSGFKYYNSITELGGASRYITPMQGFFVQAIDEHAEVVFRQDQKSSSTPNKYGKSSSKPVSFINIKLFDQNYVLLDDQAHLSFSENSRTGVDDSDALRIQSLVGKSDHISFLGKENEQRVFEGRSSLIEFDNIELIVETTKEGIFTINWDNQNQLPSHWQLELLDILSGEKLDMYTNSEYTFFSEETSKSTKPRFKILIQRTLLTDSETENPIRYELSQNYPNPFNPTTNISYRIPKSEKVKIEVFNTLGQKVAVLVDEQKSVGNHSVLFHANQLSSGVYFYRIEAGDFIQIRSMVLIK
ncbi:MAG: S8 family serine peptidase [Balneolaceae bacterium]